MGSLHVFLIALNFIALFICVGAILCRLWLFNNSFFQQANFEKNWNLSIFSSIALLFSISLIILIIRTSEMANTTISEAFKTLIPVLTDTHYGHIIILRFFLLLSLLVSAIYAMHCRIKKPYIYYLMLLILVWISFTFSATTHSADNGDFSRDEIIDWLHLLSASVWGGSILIIAIVFIPNINQALIKQKVEISELMNNLSFVCTIALCAVLITGFCNALRVSNNVLSLWGTNYGNILTIKLVFVAMMMLLGAVNRFLLVPRITAWAGSPSTEGTNSLKRIAITITSEAFIVCIIMLITANLIQAMPPGLYK